MNKTIEGGEGFDAFSREVEPRGVDADGYPVGLVVPVVPTAGEARLSMLAANTWEARGDELVQRALARVDGLDAPVATPWPSVNRRMGGGLWPGMHVVVGGTGTGKSQWALQVCMRAAQAGTPVLVLSLELDALGVFARAVSFIADDLHLPRTQWSSIYTGGHDKTPERTETTRAQVRHVLDATLPALKALPFHWVEAPPHGLPHTEIEALTRDLRALHPEHDGKPVVLVVDFLQLVAGTDPREDTITRVSRASYACRAVARDHNAVVLVLSSVSRGNVALTRIEQRDADGTTSTPPAHDLVGMGKESGDVEYSADSVFVLCPEAWAEGSRRCPEVERYTWPSRRCAQGARVARAPVRRVALHRGTYLPLDGQAPAPRAWCSTCGDVVNVELHASGAFHACVDGHRIDGAVEPVERPLTKKERTEKARATKAAEKAARVTDREKELHAMTLEKAAELTSTVVRVVEQGVQGALDGKPKRTKKAAQ
nr:hypothetical protein [Deltaproteobacteria bacterium]